MIKKLLWLALSWTLLSGHGGVAAAQQVVGLFQNDALAFEGYTMFTKADTTYLIDNAGLVVHTWEQVGMLLSHPGYLLDNGNLLIYNAIEFAEITWDGTEVWSYQDLDAHHDIEPLPNGNVLMITVETFSNAESIAAGRDPALLDNDLRPLVIREIAPPGTVV